MGAGFVDSICRWPGQREVNRRVLRVLATGSVKRGVKRGSEYGVISIVIKQ